MTSPYAENDSVVVRKRSLPETRARKRAGIYYAAFLGQRIMTDWLDTEEEAREAADEIEGSIRPCITCTRKFISEGAHNRMCGPCRNRSHNIY